MGQNASVARIFFVVTLLALAPWARADEAEALYASFHRAALAADVKGMLRLATPALRDRMTIDRNTDEQARKLAVILPQSYSVGGRAAGASRVVLDLDGMGAMLLSPVGKPSRMKGKARLVREGAEWKVDLVEWHIASEPSPAYRVEQVRPGASGVPMLVRPRRPRAVAAPARAGPRAPAR